MSNPTGMSAETGNHYRHVAGRMEAFLQRPAYSHARAHSSRHSNSSANPDLAFSMMRHGAQWLGVNPALVNDIQSAVQRFSQSLYR
jgi:hypothetical protein